MGINGLSAWVKKTHPEALQYFGARWADPRIRGKKIAIDGTLLTNRFHMARIRGYDEELRGKGGVIGWYNLVSAMRAEGVQPIVIWDQRGTRQWKAAEARKRLAARSLALARRTHEDERAERLAQFRQAFEEFEAMSDVEKGIVRSYWDTTDTGDTPKPLHLTPPATADDSGQAKQDSTPSKLKQAITSTANAAGLTAALSVGAAGAILMKAASFIGNVSELVENYQKSIKPYHCGPKETPEEVTEAIDHIRDLEEFSAELEEKPKPAEEAEDTTLIDEKIQEIVPTDYFTESPTQTALTIEEGQVIQAFLHPTEALPPTVKSVQEVSTPDPRTPTERLDDIITRSPEVRDIYDRALSLPSKDDHNDCKELLVTMGVPVVEAIAPYEAEGLASSLAKAGLVDFVGTEDSDVLAYEGPLLRNLTSERAPLLHVSGERLRDLTNLSPTSFLEFCILLGTDASPRIPHIGPVNARKLIDKYGSIDAILTKEPKIAERIANMEEFREMVASARKVFGELPPIPEGVVLEQGVWDDGAVDRLMEKKHGVRFVEPDGQNIEDEEKFEVGHEVEPLARLP